MPIRGYLARGEVDVEWWGRQIQLGLQFREERAKEKRWDTWRRYYRGEWDHDIQPSNLFFKMARTIVPRIYFRNPSVSIIPQKPGIQNAVFSMILERVDNKMIRRMKMKKHMKRIIQHAYMFGTGVGKIGYGAQYSPSPDAFGAAPTSRDGKEQFEYHSAVEEGLPWFLPTHPGSFVVPYGLDDFDAAPWCAERIVRPLTDVKNDPRLRNTNDIGAGTHLQTDKGLEPVNRGGAANLEQLVEMWEVRDKKTGRVFIIAPKCCKKPLFDSDDLLQWENRLPYHPLQFNEDDQYFWAVPDSAILEPIQRELNETRTQISKHRRLSIVRLLARRGAITEEEAEKLVQEIVSPVVWTETDPNSALLPLQTSQIPQDLVAHAELQMMDARETVGFGRNQMGEFNPGSGDTTASEARLVAQAADIRVDERRDMAADMLMEVVRDMHQIMFSRWGAEQLVDIEGPEGTTVWVSFTAKMLNEGRYEVKIDPDTSVPDTKQLREAKAIKMYQMLREDPYYDPIKLRSYLNRELTNIAFDDMLMQQFPGAIGGGPGQAIPAQQLIQAMQQQGGGNTAGGAGSGGNGDRSETMQALMNQLGSGA